MALIGNRSVIHKSPGRFLNGNAAAGGGIATLRTNFNKHGMARNAFQVFAATAAQPSGYYGGQGAWVQPKTGGAVSAHNTSAITFGATGTGAMGVAASGTSAITFAASGTGGLISSASGTAGLTFGASGALFASKAAAGTAGLTLGASGAIAGPGYVAGTAGISFAASWSPYAIGWLSGTTEEAGLTTTGIANAVWAKVIESGYSAEEIVRLLASVAAGDASGLEGATPVFRDLADTKDRITATYSGGAREVTSVDVS